MSKKTEKICFMIFIFKMNIHVSLYFYKYRNCTQVNFTPKNNKTYINAGATSIYISRSVLLQYFHGIISNFCLTFLKEICWVFYSKLFQCFHGIISNFCFTFMKELCWVFHSILLQYFHGIISNV